MRAALYVEILAGVVILLAFDGLRDQIQPHPAGFWTYLQLSQDAGVERQKFVEASSRLREAGYSYRDQEHQSGKPAGSARAAGRPGRTSPDPVARATFLPSPSTTSEVATATVRPRCTTIPRARSSPPSGATGCTK